MDDNSRKIMAKGFLNALRNFGEIQANEAKLKSAVLANEFEKKQNWFYKIQEQRQKNQMTIDLLNQIRTTGQNGKEGGTNTFFGPEIRVGEGGEVKIHYPTAGEQKLKIARIWAQIKAKQANNQPLNNLEIKFMEENPEEIIGKEQPISKQTEEDIKIKIMHGIPLTPEETDYYNKFIWKTGNALKMPKKEKTKFGEFYIGQEYKGYKYIGNNQWQKAQ